MTNVTGWNELFNNASVVKAAWVMYDTAFGGLFVAALFIIFEVLLLIKTRNITMSFVTGLLFVALFGVSTFIHPVSRFVIYFVLVVELAGILWMLTVK